MLVEQPSGRWRKTAERSAGNGMPQVPGFAILIADARSTHLPSDVKREAYYANRKATASIAIKPTINNNESSVKKGGLRLGRVEASPGGR